MNKHILSKKHIQNASYDIVMYYDEEFIYINSECDNISTECDSEYDIVMYFDEVWINIPTVQIGEKIIYTNSIDSNVEYEINSDIESVSGIPESESDIEPMMYDQHDIF